METSTLNPPTKRPHPPLPMGVLTIKLHGAFIQYWVAKDEKLYHNEKENPHYKVWNIFNKWFKNRGFAVTPDPNIVKNYQCLSKDHRVGIKNGLEFTTERFGTGFRYEFFQNIANVKNSNGGQHDYNKYERMPYRIKLMYRNEAQRLAQYARSIGMNVEVEVPPATDTEKILKDKNESCHTKVKISSLDEWIYTMKEYDMEQNSTDRDGKRIACGEEKYFYGQGNRLSCGKAYHRLNNQWIVMAGGKAFHVSAYDLFDFAPGMSRKKQLDSEKQTSRIHIELKKAEAKMDYERCIVLRNLLRGQKLYHVWSLKWNAWWGPDNGGYTSDKSRAGVYSEKAITEHAGYYNNNQTTKAIPVLNT